MRNECRISMEGDKFVITYCKKEMVISCDEFKEIRYSWTTNVFNEVRNRIAKEFRIKESNIQIIPNKKAEDRISQISMENMENLKNFVNQISKKGEDDTKQETFKFHVTDKEFEFFKENSKNEKLTILFQRFDFSDLDEVEAIKEEFKKCISDFCKSDNIVLIPFDGEDEKKLHSFAMQNRARYSF